MTVAIVTDSSACVPAELAAKHAVTVVPILLNIAGEERPVDAFERDDLIAEIEAGADVRTSAPTPGGFLEAVEERQTGDGVLVLTLAATMSATNDAASMAAQMAEGPVRVVDTGTAAGGLGLVALAAARAAEEGSPLEEVEAVARRVADEVRLVAAVGSLEQLARSGRVPAVAGRAGDALGVRPLFEFRRGEPRLLVPSLSREGSLERLVRRWRDSVPDGHRLHVAAIHADDREEATWLLDRVHEVVDPVEAFVAEFDAAMMAHTGTDLVGLSWWWEPGGS